MKVYDGASWITATSAGATSLLRFRYVATSGQTTFSGADAASATLTYTVNNIAVHRNGVTLDTSEYTASNGTSIVLNVAAGTGDIIDIIAFKSFTVADALSAVSGGTVNGAVTVTGALTTNGAFVAGGTMKGASTIGVGNATPSASGAGITFPATQSASTDANTLDDYEEGTWTPTLANQGTMTFTIRLGSYTKVGNLVVASFHIDVNTTGTGSGVLGITNLPFVVKNASGQYGFITSVHAYTWTTARSNINGLANPGGTTCDFYYGAAGTGGATQPTIADLGAGNFLASVVYLAE
jgi:hypothetical protein